MELSSDTREDGGMAEAESEADPAAGEVTAVVEPEPEPQELPPRIYAESPNGRSGRLTLISGSNSGVTLPLIKDVTGISRSGKRIAAITRRTHGYFLVPLEVGEPDHVAVTVNGEPVGRKIYPLCSSDIVAFGEIQMEFSFA
jgi:hypothetical protein